MSAKTIAIALFLAATTGAAANYVQNNPDSVRQLWTQATGFRGPLASSDGNRKQKAYTRTIFYNMCKRGFARKLQGRSSREQDIACTCMDQEIASWTKAKQDNTTLAFSQIGHDYGLDPRENTRKQRSPHRLSQHDKNVRYARERRELRDNAREAEAFVKHFNSLDKPTALNPVILLWSVQSVESVARHCGILEPQHTPRSMKEIEERYDNIGSPNT